MSSSSFVDDYLPALLAIASELVSAEFHAIVRRHGFTVLEWRVLATLARDDTLSVGELARIVMAKQPTVTRLLDRMQARGHLLRIAHGTDRRVTLVRATALGRRTVAGLIGLAREHERRVLAPLGLEESDALKRSLRTMIDRARATPTTASASRAASVPDAAAPQPDRAAPSDTPPVPRAAAAVAARTARRRGRDARP
ncbi:MAG: MarR family winged helix-turn-helix transcriptional regulator [Lautropia sp.]